jgi:hypothetical protein
MKNLIFLFSLSVLMTLVFACKPKQVISTNAFLNYEVTSAGVGAQGTSLVKAWGQGKKKADAIEDAKRNAIHALIFKGIPNSSDMRPLVPTPGAEQQHRNYFDAFFAENGTYQKFASVDADSWDKVDRISTGKGYKYGVVVVVQRDQLIRELEAAGIMKKFGM